MAGFILAYAQPLTATSPSLRDGAERLLGPDVGLWGVPESSPQRLAPREGDVFLAYVGARDPGGQALIGRAEAASAWHRWTDVERERYPEELSTGFALRHGLVWPRAVPWRDVSPRLARRGYPRQGVERLEDGDL